jgi:Major capsid protein N-terminus/Large eukaryotic DNA virus major capsid protein
MGGGLMQLVAYGAQDIYLTGQPQITFFKSVYRRHTNFSMESILQTINGSASPGSRVSVTVSRNGDLLKRLWLEYDPSSILVGTITPGGETNTDFAAIAADFGHALLDQLELEIGGQLIDRQYGKWLTVWRNLTQKSDYGLQAPINIGLAGGSNNGLEPSVDILYNRMAYTHLGWEINNTTDTMDLSGAPKRAYIPMQFWFCKNPGLAVPLIALQYHEVKFNITFAPLNNFVFSTGTTPTVSLNSLKVYADYIYLDTTERRQFAQNAHEYLIDQLQIQNAPANESNSSTVRLNFNHPVKEIIYTGTPLPLSVANLVKIYSNTDNYSAVNIGGATPYSITGDITPSQAPLSNLTSKIVLNGTDRFTERHITYFTRNQIWDCHTGYGSTTGTNFFSGPFYTIPIWDTVAVYSFALRPEEHQPSGTCNFSRIDTAQLVFNNGPINALDVYAVNYNVLRIMSGMGGLAYSN